MADPITRIDQVNLPIGYSKLRPYQVSAIEEFISEDKKGYWVGTGLGKTAIALATMYLKNPGWPVLIITRAIGRHVWVRDSKWVLGSDYIPAILRQGSKRTKEGVFRDGTFSDIDLALSEHLMVTTNYDILQMRAQELVRIPWRGLILDEAHSIKGGMKPIQYKRGGVPKFTRYHFTKLLACQVVERGGVCIQLTATPIKDRTRDLWAQLDVATLGNFLSKEEVEEKEAWARAHRFNPPSVFWFSRQKAAGKGPFGTFWTFARRYCDAQEGKYGWTTNGLTNADELESRTSKLYVKRNKREVAEELPALTRDVRALTVDLPKSDFTKSKIENAFARSAFAKFKDALELIEGYLSENGKVIVTVNLRNLANNLTVALQKHLKKTAVGRDTWVECVTGVIPTHKRSPLLDKFNEYEKKACFVATMECFSEAINLHYIDAAIVLSLPYTPGLLEQFEGRFQRIKGTPCIIHYLVAEGSVDDYVKENLLDKLEAIVDVEAGTGDQDKSLNDLKMEKTKEEIQADLLNWLNNK